eukprot:m.976511 g.976511  ORF g.976511 m.976511 type:complete len:142 (-) comp23945_c2_seq35:2568-2993(-)
MSSFYHFVIVNTQDVPLFEDEYGPPRKRNAPEMRLEDQFSNEFIIHASLDAVDAIVWEKPQMYLKVVDRFKEWSISAFTTASRVKFMLLHDVRNEDGIDKFFAEVYELYIKTLLNPFYEPGSPIESSDFRSKVKVLAKKFL